MAGSHRAPRPRSSGLPRWALAAAIVVALVPAAYFTAHRTFHDSSASPSDHTTDLPIPPVSPSATDTATVTPPSPTPTARKPSPKPKLPKVAPNAPRRITAGHVIDSGFDSSVTGLDASSDSEVARWDPRGSPGSPGTDTVYVIGRVRAGAAFTRLGDLKHGSRISIRTDSGTMTYTVSATALQPESGLRESGLFRQHHAGRLVLLGIRYDASGHRLGKALVVTAQLSGAKAVD